MKLFKSLIIAIALIASSSQAYERFKYEKQLTRLYFNPGIKPGQEKIVRIWAEYIDWTNKTYKTLDDETIPEKNKAVTIVYFSRITSMIMEYVSTAIAIEIAQNKQAENDNRAN